MILEGVIRLSRYTLLDLHNSSDDTKAEFNVHMWKDHRC